MLKNNTINLGVVKKVASALDDLNKDVVFVGGAVVALYVNDPAADEVRPTGDIDISVQLAQFGNVFALQEKLKERKFKEAVGEAVICRFVYDDVLVDVMPDEDSPWGKTNRWYKPGFKHSQQITVEHIQINILPAPYFLATKFEAFKNRGGDYRTSHDFEDIIYVIDNRINIVEEVLKSDEEVKTYLQNEFRKLLGDKLADEGMMAHLFYETATERLKMIKDKMEEIVRIEKQ
ncbi:MAG: hypothetical protein K1X56_14935 [Flavobacteriales bacterium]|nr:hypothetical protein [Flavobacteriales bacterium]